MALYAFNGTWNSEKTEDIATPEQESATNTNVIKFRDAYDGRMSYWNGVGTRIGWLGKIFGGALGVGGFERLKEAKEALKGALAAGDTTIDIIGFSRGAALAAAFANRIYKNVKDPHTGKPPSVRFIGLWDLVGSFGIPFNLGPLKFQEYNIGYQFDPPANVQYVFHALALDERRQMFRPTRLRGAWEVWFRGAHSDVGGGNGNVGLNNITLCWMLRKAKASGLPIKPSGIDAAEAGRDQSRPVKWPFDPIKGAKRALKAGDRIHYSVSPQNDPHLNEPPPGCQGESELAEQQAQERAVQV